MRQSALLLLLGVVGCSGGRTYFVETPWPEDHTAIVHVVDVDGAPLASPAIYPPGSSVRPSFNRVDRFRVFVRTYGPDVTAPNEKPFTSCGVALGREGTPLPTPTAAWSTNLVDPDDDAIGFEAERLDELAALDIHLTDCEPIDRACDGYVLERIPLPDGFRPTHVAAVSDDVALFSGRDTETSTDSTTRFVRIDGRTATLLPFQPMLDRRVEDLEWDHRGNLFGLNRGDELFVADIDGVPRRPLMPVPYDRLAAGIDGTVLGYNEERTDELRDLGAQIVERTRAPFGLERINVLRADRIIAKTQKTIYAFDGSDWLEEHEVAVLEEVRGVVTTDEIMAFVGMQEVARVKDELGSWELLERPFDAGSNFEGAAPLTGQRFVVIGPFGVLAVWTGDDWCDMRLETQWDLREIDIAEPSRVAWIVATSPDEDFAIRLIGP